MKEVADIEIDELMKLPDVMERLAEQISEDIRVISALEKLSAKAFVDVVLNSFPDSTHLQDLIIDEICTRIHPGWEKEFSGTPQP